MCEKVIAVFIFVSAFSFSLGYPVLQISDGKIMGCAARTADQKLYHAFEKIPYAAPPIGNLRFKAPQPPSKWTGRLNATHLDVACFQLLRHRGIESEDCLFLNVYTPKLTHHGRPVPVMVYLYGGGFMMGASYEYAPDLYMNNDVVLVTVNYRLGVFGFISTGDDVIPGNNGLKDQVLALKWIQQNIQRFGGDPSKVTIFGQSAGAGACAYHLLNQNSLGLFHGAILESGTCLSPGMYQRDPVRTAFTVGALLNSSFEGSTDSKSLSEFLTNLDAEVLNAAAEQFTINEIKPWTGLVDQGNIWAPVIEAKNSDAFLTRKMYGLFEAGNALRVPVMMGFTSEESIIGNDDPEVLRNLTLILDKNLDIIVPKDMRITDLENRTKEGELIRKIYTGGQPFSENLGAIIRYSSDNLLSRAMIKHAELFSEIAKTYFYQFSYDGIIGNVSGHYEGAESVGHTEELKYLFCSGDACNDPKYPAEDLLMRKRLIKLWTNFAKYQNPTPQGTDLLQNVTWPRVCTDDDDFLYLNINSTLEVRNHPKDDSYWDWIHLYKALGFNDFDTF